MGVQQRMGPFCRDRHLKCIVQINAHGHSRKRDARLANLANGTEEAHGEAHAGCVLSCFATIGRE